MEQVQPLTEPSPPEMLKLYIVLVVIIPLVSTVLALALFSWYQGSWKDIVLFLILYMLTSLGVTIGYHRLLTHRSFECHWLVKSTFLALACMSLEGDPLRWAANHIRHHANADHEGDPHSPMDGLLHAHIGWMTKPESFSNPQYYVPHLYQDDVVMFFQKSYSLWYIFSFALPFAIGGWSGLLWGGLVRIFFTHHVTWSVNSICHVFGNKPYKTSDTSSNNWLVGILAFGEGWHNNHHAFPQSAYHGLKPWQIDMSAYIIRGLAWLGLVWKIQTPAPKLLQTKAK